MIWNSWVRSRLMRALVQGHDVGPPLQADVHVGTRRAVAGDLVGSGFSEESWTPGFFCGGGCACQRRSMSMIMIMLGQFQGHVHAKPLCPEVTVARGQGIAAPE